MRWERRRPRGGRLARAFAWTAMRLRLLILLGWVAGAVAATLFLPGISGGQGQQIADLVPPDAPAIQAEQRSYRLFTFPVIGRVAVVQRDPGGLPPGVVTKAFASAIELDTSSQPVSQRPIAGALPIANELGLFPASKESSTTALTYLFFRPDVALEDQVAAARDYAHRHAGRPEDALVGVTGAIPARLEQTREIDRTLPWVTVLTVLAVTLTLFVYYRGIGPPVVTLTAAGLAFLVSSRVVSWVGQRMGASLPRDLEPVVVVLLVGIVTDYSIFFLSGFRQRVARGEARVEAAERTTADFVPIVFTAGLIVAAGTAALVAATTGFLRAFGPALALTVLVSLLVAITFIPAVLGTFGRVLFWPRRIEVTDRPELPSDPGPAQIEARPAGWRARLSRTSTARPVAAIVAAMAVAVLVAAAAGVLRMRLGFTLVSGLPGASEEVRAAAAAGEGFAPGILSPTDVIVVGTDIGSRGDALSALGDRIRRTPGVAGVIGPGLPLDGLEDLARSLFVAGDGSAARFTVILAGDPLGGPGIDEFRTLRGRMASYLQEAGLAGTRVLYAGDTALADQAITQTIHDLTRVGLVALLVDLVLLVVFLRGVVAPLYLLGASVLGLLAALGATAFVFQVVLGHDEITYYVPFGVAVLLVSLGSDYNIFVVGRIWEEARVRPLREAIAVAAPRASRTIAVAAVVLSLGFAMLAVVPLVEFREFAVAMVLGILLDAFLVRSILVPALISLFGRASWWPGRSPTPGPGGVPAPLDG